MDWMAGAPSMRVRSLDFEPNNTMLAITTKTALTFNGLNWLNGGVFALYLGWSRPRASAKRSTQRHTPFPCHQHIFVHQLIICYNKNSE